MDQLVLVIYLMDQLVLVTFTTTKKGLTSFSNGLAGFKRGLFDSSTCLCHIEHCCTVCNPFNRAGAELVCDMQFKGFFHII